MTWKWLVLFAALQCAHALTIQTEHMSTVEDGMMGLGDSREQKLQEQEEPESLAGLSGKFFEAGYQAGMRTAVNASQVKFQKQIQELRTTHARNTAQTAQKLDAAQTQLAATQDNLTAALKASVVQKQKHEEQLAKDCSEVATALQQVADAPNESEQCLAQCKEFFPANKTHAIALAKKAGISTAPGLFAWTVWRLDADKIADCGEACSLDTKSPRLRSWIRRKGSKRYYTKATISGRVTTAESSLLKYRRSVWGGQCTGGSRSSPPCQVEVAFRYVRMLMCGHTSDGIALANETATNAKCISERLCFLQKACLTLATNGKTDCYNPFISASVARRRRWCSKGSRHRRRGTGCNSIWSYASSDKTPTTLLGDLCPAS